MLKFSRIYFYFMDYYISRAVPNSFGTYYLAVPPSWLLNKMFHILLPEWMCMSRNMIGGFLELHSFHKMLYILKIVATTDQVSTKLSVLGVFII